MLRFAVVASIGWRGIGASTETCASGASTCKSDAPPQSSDDTAMIQVAKRAGFGSKFGKTIGSPEGSSGPPSLGNSEPWFPPKDGPAPKQTALIINEDGIDNEYYLPGATIIDNGKTVKYEPPYRFYLMKTPTTDYSNPDNFYKPELVGKTFTIDIDFKKDGPSCGCNLNFYLVDMPVKEAGDEGDHYCDAQCFVGKGCCPEFDMNEGNNMVQQITNHACTGKGSYQGHPDWECNKWGDPEVKTHASDFGPQPSSTIDSTKPYTFSQKFDANGGDFIFTTTMTQEGRTKTMVMGPGNPQLNDMLKDLEKRMAFVTGYWFAPDMNWMDGEECGQGTETCNQNPAYISNWRITTNGQPVPPPAPTPPPPPTPPTPTPAPTPPPVGHHCCWGGCSGGCQEDPTNYCNKGSDECTNNCGGQWC